MKERREKVVMVTAYDTPTARVADEAGVDVILVGDSLGNVVHGMDTTLGVTMEMMLLHVRAVRRGTRRALLVADMPFLSYQISPEEAMRNAGRLMAEGGAEAVKLEGADGRRLEDVSRLVAAGIPVMGHIGLVPQSVHALGGYRVQGREQQAVDRLVAEARGLQAAGAFAMVLELTTTAAARAVVEATSIPIIGIGAGAVCDGQVLVWHDALGLRPDAPAKFCRTYTHLYGAALEGLRQYKDEVKQGQFPGPEHEYE